MLPQLRQFWDMFWTKLADKNAYKTSISGMSLKLAELQESDKEAQRIKTRNLKDGYKEVDGVLHQQKLPFLPQIIQTELFSQHHDNYY